MIHIVRAMLPPKAPKLLFFGPYWHLTIFEILTFFQNLSLAPRMGWCVHSVSIWVLLCNTLPLWPWVSTPSSAVPKILDEDMDDMAVQIAQQTFATLTEFCQGPCNGNQTCLVGCKLNTEINIVLNNEYLHCNHEAVFDLKCGAVLTALSLLEGCNDRSSAGDCMSRIPLCPDPQGLVGGWVAWPNWGNSPTHGGVARPGSFTPNPPPPLEIGTKVLDHRLQRRRKQILPHVAKGKTLCFHPMC